MDNFCLFKKSADFCKKSKKGEKYKVDWIIFNKFKNYFGEVTFIRLIKGLKKKAQKFLILVIRIQQFLFEKEVKSVQLTLERIIEKSSQTS